VVLAITALPTLALVVTRDGVCAPSSQRQKTILCRHVYRQGTGILTGFPFGHARLGVVLGPTDPWLICIAKEPLPFQRQRFSRCYDPTLTRIFIPTRSTARSRTASLHAGRLPTAHLSVAYGIGRRLSPVHFRGLQP